MKPRLAGFPDLSGFAPGIRLINCSRDDLNA